MSWFLREDDAKTTPILRFAQEQALRVKPMLGGRAKARIIIYDKEIHIMDKRLKYHHLGIPVQEPIAGEVSLKDYKFYHYGFENSMYGIEYMRYEEDCPLPEIVKTKPHLAFEVEDLHEYIRDKRVIIQPNSPSEGNLVAFIEEEGMPIELLQKVSI